MLLQFISLQCLLIFQLLLRVLISLQKFVVLHLTQFQLLVHPALKLLAQRVHFILLFLHQFRFSCQNLLMSLIHVLLSLLLLDLIGFLLHLMGLLVIFLLGQVLLDLAQIEKLG